MKERLKNVYKLEETEHLNVTWDPGLANGIGKGHKQKHW